MKNKKQNFLSGVGLLGIGGAIALGMIIRKQVEEKRHKKIEAELRQFFNQFGDISVLYFNEFESDKNLTTGGVVLSDDRIFHFLYHKGQIDYTEEKR